jgi:hypothetical protein
MFFFAVMHRSGSGKPAVLDAFDNVATISCKFHTGQQLPSAGGMLALFVQYSVLRRRVQESFAPDERQYIR